MRNYNKDSTNRSVGGASSIAESHMQLTENHYISSYGVHRNT